MTVRLPLGEWLRGPLRERLQAITSPNGLARSLLPAGQLARIIEQHERGERNRATALWTLLALEVWRERFLSPAAEPLSSQVAPLPS